MKVTTYSDLRQNLASHMDQVHADHEPLLVTRSNGEHAVLMSLEDFNSYEETLYLMSSEANVDRLKTSLAEAQEGKFAQSLTVDGLEDLDASTP